MVIIKSMMQGFIYFEEGVRDNIKMHDIQNGVSSSANQEKNPKHSNNSYHCLVL